VKAEQMGTSSRVKEEKLRVTYGKRKAASKKAQRASIFSGGQRRRDNKQHEERRKNRKERHWADHKRDGPRDRIWTMKSRQIIHPEVGGNKGQ